MATATTTDKKTQIVIAGGGAAGLELARRLGARYGRKHHDIVLIDRSPTHIWKPLLHEVAAGSLDANLDEIGYRSHCRRWGYRYFNGTIEGVDRAQRDVVIAPLLGDDGSELIGPHRIRYDFLVLALGSVTNDFGTPGAREHCLVLDSRADADRFRNKLLNQCLRVSRQMSADATRDAQVSIAIVGAGATGVELAAELYNSAAALSYYGLEVFDESRLNVTLIEAGPRILPALPEKLAQAAHIELERLGVHLLVNTRVTAVEKDAIVSGTGTRINADLKLWVAGVKGADGLRSLGGLETTQNNQFVVRPTLQTTVDDRVFAMGDCCFCLAKGSERPVPPRAQAAHQMAAAVFRNLDRLQRGQALAPFAYKDHGSLISLSRFSTVGSLMGSLVGGRMAVEGRLARFFYRSLYRMHLIAVHGWLKGLALLAIGRVNAIARPRLKLH